MRTRSRGQCEYADSVIGRPHLMETKEKLASLGREKPVWTFGLSVSLPAGAARRFGAATVKESHMALRATKSGMKAAPARTDSVTEPRP